MANRGQIFDPRSLQRLVTSGYFPYTARIEEPTESRAVSGAVIYTWTPVTGMEAISCSEGIPSPDSMIAGGNETATEVFTVQYDMRVALAGYYPNITPKMRVVVVETGHTWNITAILHDPQGVYTELNCKYTDPESEPGGF